MTSRPAAALVAALAVSACIKAQPVVPAPPPDAATMAQLWVEPSDLASRDLFLGPWGTELAPDPSGSWRFVSRKNQGPMLLKSFSAGYDVQDARGTEWSVKLGAEAQAETTASRLVWALGFHQPPVYFLPSWTLTGSDKPGVKGRGRFRPDVPALDNVGNWGWHENPFVGSAPYRGLLVMMVMLNLSLIHI